MSARKSERSSSPGGHHTGAPFGALHAQDGQEAGRAQAGGNSHVHASLLDRITHKELRSSGRGRVTWSEALGEDASHSVTTRRFFSRNVECSQKGQTAKETLPDTASISKCRCRKKLGEDTVPTT